ncbi:hypothetical protein Pyn_19512 [Prunus yedoensis var. nudiflora]|uniref:Uncharacterized protein n=1 Tax=Prunus yedoensis var. nudiflora TaxID=2094558 RepID=A0A314UEP6_PRUYE|nr:hypothetical protein Pyn_19512 [Prunus yedoensis var. nudiflora]
MREIGNWHPDLMQAIATKDMETGHGYGILGYPGIDIRRGRRKMAEGQGGCGVWLGWEMAAGFLQFFSKGFKLFF